MKILQHALITHCSSNLQVFTKCCTKRVIIYGCHDTFKLIDTKLFETVLQSKNILNFFLMEGPSEWRKIAKTTIFSLWGNHATTIFPFLAYNPIAHTLEVYIHISTQGLT